MRSYLCSSYFSTGRPRGKPSGPYGALEVIDVVLAVSIYNNKKEKVKNTSSGNPSYITGLLKIYPEFIELVKIKRCRVVKAKDLCIFMGICDHYKLTWMDILRSFLEKQGLAKKLSNNRPIRYALGPQFAVIKQICKIDEQGEDYRVDIGCGLLGSCPYMVIKKLREENNNGDL